jgi:hypothetical protein
MAKDKSRGKDKGKAKKKKAQARETKKPVAPKAAGLYDLPKKAQTVTTATAPPSAPQPIPPTG